MMIFFFSRCTCKSLVWHINQEGTVQIITILVDVTMRSKSAAKLRFLNKKNKVAALFSVHSFAMFSFQIRQNAETHYNKNSNN